MSYICVQFGTTSAEQDNEFTFRLILLGFIFYGMMNVSGTI